MQYKTFENTDFSDQGEVVAEIARFNVKDHDGDVTLPGFFGTQKAPMIIGHDWSGLPVGKGRVTEIDGSAIFEGRYFVDTSHGKDAYLTAREMAEDQEWSYGYVVHSDGYKHGTFQGEQVRFLTPRKDGSPGTVVHEVSNVIRGAGVGTRTLTLKDRRSVTEVLTELADAGDEQAKELLESVTAPEGQKFIEQAESAVEAVKALTERAQAIEDLRGKRLGQDSLDVLAQVHVELSEASKALDLLLSTPSAANELEQELARFVAISARQNGITV